MFCGRLTKGARKKKLAFLADASAKASTPHPLAVGGQRDFLLFFYMYKYVYMFLKQERPEMDDFERRINFGCKEKILGKMSKFLTDTLTKTSFPKT